jgi:hypothetical protein
MVAIVQMCHKPYGYAKKAVFSRYNLNKIVAACPYGLLISNNPPRWRNYQRITTSTSNITDTHGHYHTPTSNILENVKNFGNRYNQNQCKYNKEVLKKQTTSSILRVNNINAAIRVIENSHLKMCAKELAF